MYLPMIGASSRLTSAGIISGRVMMAADNAVAHAQVRAAGTWTTASAIRRCAVCAFCSSVATIRSTVTESWSGCQQS